MKKIFALFTLMSFCLQTFAQDRAEMADAMRSSGKIYVVVATIAVIFVGLAVYLFSIDRRLKNLENDKK